MNQSMRRTCDPNISHGKLFGASKDAIKPQGLTLFKDKVKSKEEKKLQCPASKEIDYDI